MNSIFKAMKVKKIRAIDPNAPPRPNLLNHEKRLKDATGTVEHLQQENHHLKIRLDTLENKLANQTSYLGQLHQYITHKLKG